MKKEQHGRIGGVDTVATQQRVNLLQCVGTPMEQTTENAVVHTHIKAD